MRSGKIYDHDAAGDDSFLDVVANVVGVLIILVMLVSASASQSSLIFDTPDANNELEPKLANDVSPTSGKDIAKLRSQLEEAMQESAASRRAIQESTARIMDINHEAMLRDQQRNQLALHRAIVEKDIEQRRENLDTDRQREFDVQRQITESRIKLDEYVQEQIALAGSAEKVTEIECVPTPLAKTINEEAIHLRIRKGMVSVVPFEELKEQIENLFPEIRRQLQSRDVVSDAVGPIEGYRMRFTVKRQEVSLPGGPRAGYLPKSFLDYFVEVLPTAEDLGQNVEQSLMSGSALYEHLQAHRRQSPPVVVWLYSDSFAEFGPLKRKLWEMGFSVATRPMELGARIGASPRGTRAAAQ